MLNETFSVIFKHRGVDFIKIEFFEQKLRFCISVFTFNISYSSSSEENSSNIKKSSSINSKENKSAKELKSMKNPTSNLPKPSSSKPRATPTKIQERRPPITNKNLNNLKKSNR